MASTQGGAIKKRIKAGEIAADIAGSAVVVNFITVVSVMDETTREVLHEESKPGQKRIPVKLSEHTNIPALTKEIIEKCRYVNPTKEPMLLRLLEQMRDAIVYGVRTSSVTQPNSQSPSLFGGPSTSPPAGGSSSSSSSSTPSMSKLREYVEMLYEDGEKKTAGAEAILELAKDKGNLEVIAEDDSVLKVLARILTERESNSPQLSLAVVSIFFYFSSYSVFHSILMTSHVGEACFSIIELELSRRKVYIEEINEHKRDMLAQPPNSPQRQALEKEVALKTKKLTAFKPKQEQLMAVCFRVLLNMAESSLAMERMVKRNLLQLLVACLEMEGEELLLIVTTFLKNLSIYQENIKPMLEAGVVAKIQRLLSHANPQIKDAVVRLTLNLSFSPDLQAQMMANGFLPKLVALILEEDLQTRVIQVLYQLSLNEKHRPEFISTQISAMLRQFIIKWPEDRIGEDVIGLAVNLSSNEKMAEQLLVNGAGTAELVSRFSRTLDPLLLKMLHNASHSETCQHFFENVIEQLVSTVKSSARSKELLVDLMGIFANLSSAQIDWASLVAKYDLLDFLAKVLQQQRREDDIVVEVAGMLATIVSDRKVASSAAREDIVGALVDIVSEKKGNEGFAVHLLHTLYKFVLFKDTRSLLLNTRFAGVMLDFYTSRSPTVKAIVSTTLDLIAECDAKLGDLIKTRKFELHNAKWLQLVNDPASARILKYEAPPNIEEESSPGLDNRESPTTTVEIENFDT